jgi:hypothetical protein
VECCFVQKKIQFLKQYPAQMLVTLYNREVVLFFKVWWFLDKGEGGT